MNEAASTIEPARGSANSKWLAYLQLIRLPAVFTAMADVLMGYLVVFGSLRPGLISGMLVATSCLLYWSGMVLNDVRDVEQDTRERPQRPIPSGRVSRRAALNLACGLIFAGVLLGWVVSYLTGNFVPGIVAFVLALCILLYDGVLKFTFLGPVTLGACRFCNVLLGMSLAASQSAGRLEGAMLRLGERSTLWGWEPGNLIIAAGIGVYAMGITEFARTEAVRTSRARLTFGTGLMAAGMALLASLPLWEGQGIILVIPRVNWYLLWLLIAAIIVRRCAVAIGAPSPRRVQAAVRSALMSIIVLDAAVVAGTCGFPWAVAVLLLIVPAFVLGRWMSAT